VKGGAPGKVWIRCGRGRTMPISHRPLRPKFGYGVAAGRPFQSVIARFGQSLDTV
jgi:hypothetical protein